MKDTEYLKKLYISKIRELKKNEWIQIKASDEYLFDGLADALHSKDMNYEDYIDFHFKNPKYITSSYVCSMNAVRRYEVHQKLKSKYSTKNYVIDGKTFYVNKTYKEYPLSQVKGSVASDPEANFAVTMSEKDGIEDMPYSKELLDSCEYAIVKFEYLSRTPPTSLVNLTNEQRKKANNGQ